MFLKENVAVNHENWNNFWTWTAFCLVLFSKVLCWYSGQLYRSMNDLSLDQCHFDSIFPVFRPFSLCCLKRSASSLWKLLIHYYCFLFFILLFSFLLHSPILFFIGFSSLLFISCKREIERKKRSKKDRERHCDRDNFGRFIIFPFSFSSTFSLAPLLYLFSFLISFQNTPLGP